jgi:acetyltransferase-like isoleucine patch superfamily enzyme/dTDP-4-dehydrorhamnose 3,5-epimerase-like enzyme
MRDVRVHDLALCESLEIGPGTRIGAFAQVLEGAQIGADCEVLDGARIEGGASVGERVRIGCGAQVRGGVKLCDDVVIGPNAVFADESPSNTDASGGQQPSTVVHADASIGANTTILADVEIGRGASVGAGSVVTRSVPPNAIVTGNPAYIVGYSETRSSNSPGPGPTPLRPGDLPLGVGGVSLRRSAEFSDLRGSLTAGELPHDSVPFVPRRWFLVYDVPNQEVRGEHAHRACHQFLVCVSGSMRVAVDDGERRAEVTLDARTLGLYIPPLVWASQFHYSPNSVLLVLASDSYDPSDYIRDYELFLLAAGEARDT